MTSRGAEIVATMDRAVAEQKGRMVKASTDTHHDKLASLATSFARLFPHRPKKECQYCCESKPPTAFTFILTTTVPHGCRVHLRQVCRTCLRASLSAQLDSKPLLDVGCPSCSTPWDTKDLRVLLGHKDKRRFKELDLLAKARSLVPSEMPEEGTLQEMLLKGTRFCPWCRFAFIKDGGCNYMTCSKCWRSFDVSYALVLEDGRGRRAAPVDDEYSTDDW